LLSLQGLLAPSLAASQRRTLHAYTRFDPHLVEDGTYHVLEIDGRIAASGGWSRRAALIRGPGETSAEERFLDPSCDAAAVRAMYTHPDFARMGLGTILLATAEAAARLAGFRRAELIATSTGRALYLARGWRDVSHITLGPDDGSAIDVFLMQRNL
jgi:GNAT superfamily N-acetyltransferase